MKKGQIFIVIVMLLMVGILSAYKIDMDKMRQGEDVVFSTWGVKYRPSVEETESGEKQTLKKETIKYNKLEIESSGEKISLKVPEDWKYEEISGDTEYKKGVRIYNDNFSGEMDIGFYNGMFGVCGTGLEHKEITLENGQKISAGYYYDNEWDFIVFESEKGEDAIVSINKGIKGENAERALEIVKSYVKE